MTSDEFVSAIDGLTFDENGRTWTLEVDDVDDTESDAVVITVRVPEAEREMHFDVPRHRELETAALQERVIDLARELVIGRKQSGSRMPL